MPGYALAVDIGGTFTDVVLRAADGRTWVDKTLTTHHDLLEGFFHGVDLALARAGAKPVDVNDVVVHATTVVTNAVIERKGPACGLIVTRGFADMLEIRDEHRYDMFDPQIEFAPPLIPRSHTFELTERVRADGSVSVPADDAEIDRIADELARRGIVSVGVCLLNSYVQGANERRVRDRLKARLPSLYVSISSEVAPQIREYLRCSTTAINCYTQPITEPYLRRLAVALGERSMRKDPLIMLSNGGVIGAQVAGQFPVRMIESGPAAGALVAAHYAQLLGLDRLLSFDMGGTTAKACVIIDQSPLVSGRFEVDRRYRFKEGSGMPCLAPAIDMIEIGAGGGSIAHVDNLGLLKVGPQSAGSQPGPVCYRRGGVSPTVTDADLVLGFLDAENFLGGDMKLDRAGAAREIGALGARLGSDVEETALGIYRVVGESMAAAARTHATDRGIDYRGLPLLAFGGAGPVHACYVADRLESGTVIFPPLASVLSAYGTLVTPLRLDLQRSAVTSLANIDWSAAMRHVDEMQTQSHAALVDAGAPAAAVHFAFSAEMRYAGQQNEVKVELTNVWVEQRDAAAIRTAFETTYETMYQMRLPQADVEIVAWGVTAFGPKVNRELTMTLPSKQGQANGQRRVYFERTPRTVDVYDRALLAVGQTIAGPAIIEERETTLVIPPGWRVQVNALACVIATKG